MGTGVVGLEVTEEGPRGRGYIFCSARRETTSRPLCPTHSCLGLCPAGSSACSALLQPLHRLGHAGTSGPGANRAITPCFLQTATVPSSQCLRKYRWARGFTVLTVQVPIVCSSALAPCQAPCWWRLRGTRPALTNQLPVRSLLRPVFTERQTEPLRAQQPLRVSYWAGGGLARLCLAPASSSVATGPQPLLLAGPQGPSRLPLVSSPSSLPQPPSAPRDHEDRHPMPLPRAMCHSQRNAPPG